jgi:hypothetical protein
MEKPATDREATDEGTGQAGRSERSERAPKEPSSYLGDPLQRPLQEAAAPGGNA